MTIRHIKSAILIGTTAIFSPVLKAEEKTNILFIFADDHAYDCIASHGNSEILTPHLDKLTKQGTRFTHAYNSGAWNGAVCIASRTMMMTGKQIWTAHKANLGDMIKKQQLFPQLMQKAGYDTYFSGKWHVGAEKHCKASWKNTLHIRPGMPNQTSARYNRNWEPGQDSWSPYDMQHQGFWKGGKHWSEVLADDGINMLNKATKNEKPFMMMLCFNAPHDPRQAPKEYHEKYPYHSIKIPKNFLSVYPDQIGSNQVRDEKLAPFPRTKYSIQVNKSEYYALITHMDAQIGRILEALEKSGKADNTIVLFSADHGLAVGQHGFLGKQNMYEHSVRAPWIIAGKNIPKGKVIQNPIYIQDAMATCLDIAGVKKSNNIHFQSVLPLLRGDTSNARAQIYSSYTNHQRMVIEDGFKLISYPITKTEKLFDLNNDPLEVKNLVNEPKYSHTLQSLRKTLVNQMQAMSDPLLKSKK